MAWAKRQGVYLDFIQPGEPQQNAYIERYNRTVHYDWLAHYLFDSSKKYSATLPGGYGPIITSAPT